MKQEISALDIKGNIASGKIALYGILFDTGKSEIKPESEKAIISIATFLKENPGVNVYIVRAYRQCWRLCHEPKALEGKGGIG